MRKNGNVIWIAPRDELATQGETEPRIAAADRRTGSHAHRILPDELPARRRRAASALGSRPAGALQARQRGGRCAHQHPVRPGRAQPAGGGPQADRQDRRAGAPGGDRGAHRDRRRQLFQEPRRATGLQPGGPPDSRHQQWFGAGHGRLQPVDTRHRRHRPAFGSLEHGAERQPAGDRPERLQRGRVRLHPVQPRLQPRAGRSKSRRWKPTARARSSPARAC